MRSFFRLIFSIFFLFLGAGWAEVRAANAEKTNDAVSANGAASAVDFIGPGSPLKVVAGLEDPVVGNGGREDVDFIDSLLRSSRLPQASQRIYDIHLLMKILDKLEKKKRDILCDKLNVRHATSPNQKTIVPPVVDPQASVVFSSVGNKDVLSTKPEKTELEQTGNSSEHPMNTEEKKKELEKVQDFIDRVELDLEAISGKATIKKTIVNGVGKGFCGNFYQVTGNPGHDIATALIAKSLDPASALITENGKAFWSKLFFYISRVSNKISNKLFGTATFTIKEVESWKIDIFKLVATFESANKRSAGIAATSHGLALRSGSSIFSSDEKEPDTITCENKSREDVELMRRKVFCEHQIKSILAEIAMHKKRSLKCIALCARVTLVEMALQGLLACIMQQTSLSELTSATASDLFCVWRDLIMYNFDSIISALEVGNDNKQRTAVSSYGSMYGSGYGYGSYGTGSSY